jgi:hypothetical protein
MVMRMSCHFCGVALRGASAEGARCNHVAGNPGVTSGGNANPERRLRDQGNKVDTQLGTPSSTRCNKKCPSDSSLAKMLRLHFLCLFWAPWRWGMSE